MLRTRALCYPAHVDVRRRAIDRDFLEVGAVRIGVEGHFVVVPTLLFLIGSLLARGENKEDVYQHQPKGHDDILFCFHRSIFLSKLLRLTYSEIIAFKRLISTRSCAIVSR